MPVPVSEDSRNREGMDARLCSHPANTTDAADVPDTSDTSDMATRLWLAIRLIVATRRLLSVATDTADTARLSVFLSGRTALADTVYNPLTELDALYREIARQDGSGEMAALLNEAVPVAALLAYGDEGDAGNALERILSTPERATLVLSPPAPSAPPMPPVAPIAPIVPTASGESQ